MSTTLLNPLNPKDQHEINYWKSCTPEILDQEKRRLALLRDLFPLPLAAASVLGIGVGPQGGVLSFIEAPRRVGVDPLFTRYVQMGFSFPEDIELIEEYFERWQSEERFEIVVSTNALDHGEMGFHTLPQIARRLLPGGRFYLHVHLRPPELLNVGHDHSLTIEQLDKELARLPLRELKRELFPNDVDGNFCTALLGIWERTAG